MGEEQMLTAAVFLFFVGVSVGLMFAPYIYRLK